MQDWRVTCEEQIFRCTKEGEGAQNLGFLQVSHLGMVDLRCEWKGTRDSCGTWRNKIIVVNKSSVQDCRSQMAYDGLGGIR